MRRPFPPDSMTWFRRPLPLTLTNGVLVTPDRKVRGALRLVRGRIASIGGDGTPEAGDFVVNLDGAYVYPGLINAHDHLELDLFSRIGQGPYPNSYAWFEEVNRQRDTPAMRRVLAIPVADRLRWGGYRNLFSGVTTVAQHNPYRPRVFDNRFPIRVVRRYGWSHSLRLAGTYGGHPGAEWKKTKPGEPFIIHLAEGVDAVAAGELTQLDRLGALAANTVVVHGVGLTRRDHDLLQERGASLVWCPSSNLFLFHRTAYIPALAGRVPIALGTDSTLSGPPTLFDELRTADRLGYAAPGALVRMVTAAPARMLGLAGRTGRLEPGGDADVLVLDRIHEDPYRNLIAATPADVRLVLMGGMPRFGDPAFAALFERAGVAWERIIVEGAGKVVTGPCRALVQRLRRAVGDALPIAVDLQDTD